MPGSHPNLKLFKSIYDAFTSGDMGRLGEYFADDVVWHTPGASQLAGTYAGKPATFESFGREFELSGGTYDVEIRESLANDEHIVAFLRARAQRQEKVLDQPYALVFRIERGQVAEAWEVWDDQEAVDNFWS